MTRYITKLTEQEEMSLKQLVAQPGFEPLIKLLQFESLLAQSRAMECTSADRNERLMALTDAQRTAEVVSNLTIKLYGYREQLLPQTEEEQDPFITELWERKGERTN